MVAKQQLRHSDSCDAFPAHTHPFNGPLSGTTHVSRYQKGKTNLDFTGARDSEWQWHQLGHMQVCTSFRQITMPAPHYSVFFQAGCPSCRPTNSVKALKALTSKHAFVVNPYTVTAQGPTIIRKHVTVVMVTSTPTYATYSQHRNSNTKQSSLRMPQGSNNSLRAKAYKTPGQYKTPRPHHTFYQQS